jgi:hypothetical protein
MRVRPWLSAPFALALLAGWTPLVPQAPRKYRLDMKTAQVVDLAALGQGEQRTEFTSTAFVTVTLADTAGGKTIHLVLDSMLTDSTSPIPQEAVRAAAGSAWHGLVGRNGRISEFKAVGTRGVGEQFAGVFRQFLPPIPVGKKAGDQWTDTTEITDDLGTGSLATRTVTNFQAASEIFQGTRALKVAAAASSSFNGMQNVQGQDAAIEGTGTATATWFIAADGAYLGGTLASKQALTLAGGFAPEPIPIAVTIETTTTLLP